MIEFSESWKGNIPLIVVPTTYPTVSVDELIKNKFKMIIYANQTLRSAYSSMQSILKKIQSEDLSNLNKDIVSMEKIFELQKMYDVKEEEKEIQKELKKMGYMD